MVLIETPAFTKRVTQLLTADEYRLLQATLVENPEAGATISGSGGLRKYWISKRGVILLLFLFAKNGQSDLTFDQQERLRSTVQREFE